MRRLLVLSCLLAVAAGAQEDPRLAFVAGRENLAAGRPVELAPTGNYRLTAAEDTDAVDLTDGRLGARDDEQLWFEPLAVAYQFNPLIRWKVDLGEVQPIDEVAIRLLGGAAQGAISFPNRVLVLVSDDGEAWHTVATFDKTDAAMAARELPAEVGKAWIRPLRFTDLHTRGRYLGVQLLAGGSLTAADELFVFAGDHNPAAVSLPAESERFVTAGVVIYIEKPVYRFSTNVATYGSLGCLDNRPEDERGKPITVTIDTPPGVTLEAGSFPDQTIRSDRSYGDPPADDQPPERAAQAGGERVTFASKAVNERSWAKIFLTGDAPEGAAGEMVVTVGWDGGESSTRIPLEAITIPAAPQPTRLVTNMGWVGVGTAMLWPDFLEAYGQLGFNTVPVFVRWHDPADPDSQRVYDFLEDCRAAGYGILDMESPIHPMLSAQKNNPDIHLKRADGTVTTQFNPAYRGEHYQDAIALAVDRWAPTRAEMIFFDIEWWNWRGPYECEQDPLCQARKQELGIETWEEFRVAMGEEMMADLVGAYRAKAQEIGVDPDSLQFGGYDFQSFEPYQEVWDLQRLYPELIDFAQPSWYTPLTGYNLTSIREAMQRNRAHLPANDILPWLTPGDSGEFDSRRMVWALSEIFLNGGRGYTWWSGRTWDPDDFRATATIARWFTPYEDLVVDGRPRLTVEEGGQEWGAPPTATGPGSAVMTVKGNEALLLVTAYGTPGEAATTVTLPADVGGKVTAVESGEAVATLAPGGSFEVTFGAERARLFHIGP